MEKNRIYLVGITLTLTCLGSCFTRPHVMTTQAFSDIRLGESVGDMEKKVGKPYAVHKEKDGSFSYEYIERISVGTEVVEDRHYYVIVKDGQVVSKSLKQKKPPAYDLIYDDDPNDVELQ